MEGGDTTDGGGENVGLLVLEPKSFRPFKTKDEYLYAMKEDLAEWFKCLYEDVLINADNFLEILETGVLLCTHANEVRKFTAEQKAKGIFEVKSNFVRGIQIPEYDVSFRFDVKPGTFLARDNISNFITWTSKMGIPEVLRFETDDLVMRKNERSVVLCLLEVARVGAKFGMLAPTIVQMEEEIDNEIETGEPPPQIITCDVKSLDEMVRELVGRCTCPIQFAITKVGEGKYKIGDNQTLVFVRILRKHVMIRVGGGWDTLEHYLDKHDPCRCGFKGHRGGGRAPSTPRRLSTTNVSHSLPNTPKTSRKLSMTLPASNSHSSNATRPASPSMRSQSPGPNSRKLGLSVKQGGSQPGSTVTSPGVVNKQPNFTNVGLNSSLKQQNSANSGLNSSGKQVVMSNGLNSSGGYSLGNFVKQSHANLTRQASSGSSGSQPPSTPRGCSSPAPRAPSPGPGRRSESPAPPSQSNRLKSPSPAPASQRGVSSRTQSVPAMPNGRCQSPIKQITLSELRSSREGKPVSQPPNTTPKPNKTLQRQTSNQSSTGGDDKNMEPDLTMEKISTMSLGEFRNLLNNALSVPNGNADSLSDSPRSQSSQESSGKNTSGKKKDKWAHVKSSYSYRPAKSSNKSGVQGLDSASSGYSSSSVASDRTINSYSTANNSTFVNKSNGSQKSTSMGNSLTPARTGVRSVSNTSLRQTSSTGLDYGRPKTPTSISKSKSNMTSVSDSAYNSQIYGSRSSSHSSLRSYESYDSHLLEDQQPSYTRSDRIPLTPSSVNSDYSYSDTSTSQPESPGYTRSNSYTPCSILQERNLEQVRNTRASSEPKETIINSIPEVEKKPLNVGYVSFSHSDKNDENKYLDELNEIDNEIMQLGQTDSESLPSSPSEITSPSESRDNRKQSIARPSTPSMIPRPMTPKVSRKMSVPDTNTLELSLRPEDQNVGRPPTPKKPNVLARAPGSSTVKSSDKSKEQTYKQIFQKRSMTPGPGTGSGVGTRSTSVTPKTERRSTTPGPYLHQKASTLSTTSATTTRARLNQTLDQTRNRTASASSSVDNPESRAGSRPLSRQGSGEQPEAVITVNRSGGSHSLTVHNRDDQQTIQKSKVLARARTEDNRARQQARTPQGGISRQRPQSVEPRQLMPRKNSSGQVLSVKRTDDGNHQVYDRTEEWVQTAVKQTTKTHKTKTPRAVTTPRTRRAMTPNSFDLKMEIADEEPRSLDEIKAALSLPINGLSTIPVDTEKLDAPPEDPETYAQMEALFHELRQQELKASVNETPGSSTSRGRKSSKSKSNSSNNDEDVSLDSNKNIKRKTLSVSTKSSTSNVMSPTLPRQNQVSKNSPSPQSQSVYAKPQPASRTSSVSSAGTSSYTRSTSSRTGSQPPRPASPRTATQKSNTLPAQKSNTLPARPTTLRPSSPSPKPFSQAGSSRSPAARPSSPSPKFVSLNQRPPSPRTPSQSSRPESPLAGSQPPRPASPRTSTRRSPSPSPMSSQPPRPASTPPRSCTPVDRKSARSNDDNDIISHDSKTASSIISKIKEIIKVKPRKDKADGVKVKSRIPAPKSLSNVGKSRSFSNLSNLSDSMSVAQTGTQFSLVDEPDQNGYEEQQINGGLNVTLSGRGGDINQKPKLMPQLTTGRSTLIRKESMDKNKRSGSMARVMSLERGMSGLQNTYQFYDDGEYV